MAAQHPLDDGPFFHGTRAELMPGDHVSAGFRSNYRSDVVMNHVYFTASPDGAGLAAELAVILGSEDARLHVYRVEVTDDFENDPNVTDKKFPGNPTRSYRSAAPLIVIEEITAWTRLTPEAREEWRRRLAELAASGAEIIN
ncbi:rifampin ADP-ribosylating transferase [Microbacterium sp. SLBN-154]|uniref:NAD(+)--rifampin ADP-ribosyltransferase n=1 Tax=Microbacterium sp. SLBN-154 TaxID=2768458 RepID=UPI001173E19C|nr:NAD(+)--rifampin ADP-ribosyltransferase [Microbacterium sp. SLBN-154]TQK20121.1 rifampin ADP-ribosylating transferase [Microbacterium sp. SLBN-154]